MHDGKWIDDLTADMPLADAARLVLATRLGVVARCLPPALRHAQEDVEHVHQLRVATRRARAALDIFQGCLDEDAYDASKKQLRRIRRVAGAARDWDVFLAALAGSTPRLTPPQVAGRDLLVGFALAQRGAAQQQLDDLGDDYPDRFEKLQAEVLAGVWDRHAQAPLVEHARQWLTGLVGDLEQKLAGDLDDYSQLHQVRIAGKRLRYAMEVFAACFTAPFRDQLYPVVEEMQEILGDANDSNVTLGHLRQVLELFPNLPARAAKRCRIGIEAMQRFYERRLTAQRRRFGRWQKRWRQQNGIAAFLEVR